MKTPPGIVAMLARLAGEQSQAAYEAVIAGASDAAGLAAQAAETYRAARDPEMCIRFWNELCPVCKPSFYAWRDAKDPNDLSHLPVHAVAFACPSGYDSAVRAAKWRETVSYQLVLVRALCTAGRHGDRPAEGKAA